MDNIFHWSLSAAWQMNSCKPIRFACLKKQKKQRHNYKSLLIWTGTWHHWHVTTHVTSLIRHIVRRLILRLKFSTPKSFDEHLKDRNFRFILQMDNPLDGHCCVWDFDRVFERSVALNIVFFTSVAEPYRQLLPACFAKSSVLYQNVRLVITSSCFQKVFQYFVTCLNSLPFRELQLR